jgi:ribonuclease HI
MNDDHSDKKRPESVVIYTDGAAEPNPGPGGYGVVLMSGKLRKELSGGFRKTTNNRMELMAVIVALESLKRPCRVVLYSDSKYIVDSVSRGSVMRWEKNEWFRSPGERAKNIDLWKRFLVVFRKHSVEFRWVKGHAGVMENERCDELAVAAAQQYDLPLDEGYLEESESRNLHSSVKKITAADSLHSPSESNDDSGEECRKCNTRLVRKETKKKTPKPGQAYCYDWYLLCPGCGTMYMVDAAKRLL